MLSDIDETIALWQRRPLVTAFDVWLAMGHKPWASVGWADVRRFMIDWSER